jgi:hypothetical protein
MEYSVNWKGKWAIELGLAEEPVDGSFICYCNIRSIIGILIVDYNA